MPLALISVYEKKGISEFARDLIDLGWELFGSAGTVKAVRSEGMAIEDVATLSGLPPILDHRVVTLVPQIHAGLLARPDQRAELEARRWPFFDLACIDLYPLYRATHASDVTTESVLEMTDIGGPTMLRSAAKGRRIVIADPEDRSRVINWLKRGKPHEAQFINDLCAKAEAIVANYCLESARFHGAGRYDGFLGEWVRECTYGENPYQSGAGLFRFLDEDRSALERHAAKLGLHRFQQIEGAPPSYVNLADLDRLLQTLINIITVFWSDLNMGERTAMVPFVALGAKHGNCCGAAFGYDKEHVITKMIEGDPESIFGGQVIMNFAIDQADAQLLLGHGTAGTRLLDGVIAPEITEEAAEVLSRKRGKCRLWVHPGLSILSPASRDDHPRFRMVQGGFLRQAPYEFALGLNAKISAVQRHGQLGLQQEEDLLFAAAIGATSNSNTITIVKNGMMIANAVGQQSRVAACRLALAKASGAGHEVNGAMAYSDSFFPFPDGPETLIQAGVTGILATSGSVNDAKVIDHCKTAGIPLYLIPDKLARGFFGH